MNILFMGQPNNNIHENCYSTHNENPEYLIIITFLLNKFVYLQIKNIFLDM